VVKVLNISTFYAPVVDAITAATHGLGYAETLARFEDALFGSDLLWSAALRRATGWEVVDVVANAPGLQRKWVEENCSRAEREQEDALWLQIRRACPDAIVFQDLSVLPPQRMDTLRSVGVLLVAQISCPMPRRDAVSRMDLAFTSFPHYVARLRDMGVGRVESLPLAFEPRVIERIAGAGPLPERDIDVCFVGGVGRDSHWLSGTDALERAAADLGPGRLHWYGYGKGSLPPGSPLAACWRGEAWGREMYALYLRSKIVLNRHGEVAKGSGNNLRQYEATGCGACLLTDQPGVFSAGFECAVYGGPDEIGPAALDLLGEVGVMREIAAAGQRATLGRHAYSDRMGAVAVAVETEARRRRIA